MFNLKIPPFEPIDLDISNKKKTNRSIEKALLEDFYVRKISRILTKKHDDLKRENINLREKNRILKNKISNFIRSQFDILEQLDCECYMNNENLKSMVKVLYCTVDRLSNEKRELLEGIRIYIDNKCPICVKDFSFGTDNIVTSFCGHVFHKECYDRIRSHSIDAFVECPVCKSYYNESPITINGLLLARNMLGTNLKN